MKFMGGEYNNLLPDWISDEEKIEIITLLKKLASIYLETTLQT